MFRKLLVIANGLVAIGLGLAMIGASRSGVALDQSGLAIIGLDFLCLFNFLYLLRMPKAVSESRVGRLFGLWYSAKEAELSNRAKRP